MAALLVLSLLVLAPLHAAAQSSACPFPHSSCTSCVNEIRWGCYWAGASASSGACIDGNVLVNAANYYYSPSQCSGTSGGSTSSATSTSSASPHALPVVQIVVIIIGFVLLCIYIFNLLWLVSKDFRHIVAPYVREPCLRCMWVSCCFMGCLGCLFLACTKRPPHPGVFREAPPQLAAVNVAVANPVGPPATSPPPPYPYAGAAAVGSPKSTPAAAVAVVV